MVTKEGLVSITEAEAQRDVDFPKMSEEVENSLDFEVFGQLKEDILSVYCPKPGSPLRSPGFSISNATVVLQMNIDGKPPAAHVHCLHSGMLKRGRSVPVYDGFTARFTDETNGVLAKVLKDIVRSSHDAQLLITAGLSPEEAQEKLREFFGDTAPETEREA